jgi:hypothetical protein
MNPKPKISKDDVEALSRGLKTRSRSGSRSTGHRLTQKERLLFERAKVQGELRLPLVGSRANLKNVYLKWCEAVGVEPKILDRSRR